MADMFPVPSTQESQSKIPLPAPIAPVKPIPPVTSNIQQPVQVSPSPTVDSVSATNKVAIGWSPDQARQGLDITAQRTDAEKKRVYKQAQLQVLEQLNQQIKTTEGEIATESSAISQLQGEIGSLTGQVSSMQNEASSLESQIAAAREAARRAAEAAEAARQAAQRQQPTQQASPASYETPNGGWIGQDYYADVNAARAASAAAMA